MLKPWTQEGYSKAIIRQINLHFLSLRNVGWCPSKMPFKLQLTQKWQTKPVLFRAGVKEVRNLKKRRKKNAAQIRARDISWRDLLCFSTAVLRLRTTQKRCWYNNHTLTWKQSHSVSTRIPTHSIFSDTLSERAESCKANRALLWLQLTRG